MILSGWILPDGSEIRCISCSSLRGHINAIKKYLNTDNHIEGFGYISDYVLDDYAVKELGWIKIIDRPYKYVFYRGKEKYDICSLYEKYGYIVVEI